MTALPLFESSAIDRLCNAQVYFGLQSVGRDVLVGVRAAVTPRKLAWRERNIGRNGDPLGKLQAFGDWLRASATRPELALFKFCYVDFDAGIDPATLFASYVTALETLRKSFGGTQFVHVTAPLTAPGLRGRVLGPLGLGDRGNRRRDAYNQLLRSTFRGREPVFDLAAVESGRRPVGRAAPSLRRDLTDDGAHLNERGRSATALELLRVLAGALDVSLSRDPVRAQSEERVP